ncbi:KIF-binding protein-like [Diorhabda sublineata]|uniref:KIF-binding protein-like n=1 Tax=Diorhabda sublineata TaxID=1163346 RepID=UPI0024E156AC|nr:KIF-binding protein-like [Diorhabda sublineata]
MEFDEIVIQLKGEYDTIRLFSACKARAEIQIKDSGDDNSNERLLETDFSLIETKLEDILSRITEDSPDYAKKLSMITSILYEKAKVCLTMNLLPASRNYLERALDIMQGYTNNPQITFIYLRVVNYLSYVLSRMGDFETAKNLLERVVNEEIKCVPIVYSTEDLFVYYKSDEQLAKMKLEKLKTNNMQMLGWVYGKLGLTHLYAETIHNSLQKELNINDSDPINWSIRCYRLASLFIVKGKWENARYHLTAAQTILDPLEVNLIPNETLFKAQADLARVWVSYGIQLFGLSKRSVLEKVWDENSEINRQDKLIDTHNFTFEGMDITVPDIPIKEIRNIREARDLFTHTHKWLKRARLFYTLREYPLQYVNIILELSELYKYLASYEKDIDAQYDVHKKRFETLEMLSSVVRDVRPGCYATVCMEIIREIMDVQIEMMHLNLKRIYNPTEDAQLTDHQLRKRMDTIHAFTERIEKLCDIENVREAFLIREINEAQEESSLSDIEIGVSRSKEPERRTDEKHVNSTKAVGKGEEKRKKRE